MKKPTIILLDMDGVIANFMGGVSEVFGINVENYHSWNVNEFLGISEKKFWNEIHRQPFFWMNLEKYEWADYLVQLCEKKADEVYICTSPAMDGKCYSEKYEWICDNYPQFKNKIILTNNKQLLANDKTILIDDSSKNCKQFYQNDGKYIMFPQPWNPNNTYIHTRMQYIKQQLNILG